MINDVRNVDALIEQPQGGEQWADLKNTCDLAGDIRRYGRRRPVDL